MKRKSFFNRSFVFFIIISLLFPQFVSTELSDGMGASDIIGQYADDGSGNLTPYYTKNGENDGPSNLGFSAPAWSLIDTEGHYFFVSDSSNHRVLIYELDDSNDFLDYKADYVLGQTDFAGDSATTTQYGLNSPQGLAYDSLNKRLFVSTLSRVMVFDFTNGITSGMNASYVLGQTTFLTSSGSVSQTGMSGARGLVYDPVNSRLFVAQSSAHRVTVYDVSTSTMANGIPATHVIGQSSFTAFSAATSQTGMAGPYGLAYEQETERLFVAQYNNNRVLVYNASPGSLLVTSTPGMYVLGQPNFISNSNGLTAVGMYQPYGLALDSSTKRLFVAQSGGNKVGVYDISTSTISNGMAATHVLGQPDFNMLVSSGSTSFRLDSPRGVTFDHTNNRLYVVQDGWMRISVFDVSVGGISNGMDAVDMLGQYTKVDDNTYLPNYTKTGRNNGSNEFGLHTPNSMTIDRVNHRLFISDTTNNRVLVHSLNSNNQMVDYEADYVLGQTDFDQRTSSATQSTMTGPTGLAYSEDHDFLFVSDAGNHRVLIFDTSSLSNGMNASYVLGQSTFTGKTQSLSVSGLYGPQGLSYDSIGDYLFVADTNNNRVLMFSFSPDTVTNGMSAVDVFGQLNFNENTSRVSQGGLSGPVSLTYDSGANRLFVGQSSNRISVFDISVPQESVTYAPSAIDVLGKIDYDENNNIVSSLIKTGKNNGTNNLNFGAPADTAIDTINHRLFISDRGSNRVLVYDLDTQGYLSDYEADYVLGKPNFELSAAGNSASYMNVPEGLAYDEVNQRLFVAQSGIHRVTVYDLSGGITNGMDASYVLGQSTFTGSFAATTQSGLSTPLDVVFVTSTNQLFVAQSGNHRVTVYDLSGGITNGMNASYVLGQSTFTGSSAATTQAGMSSPASLAYDPGNNQLFVAQSGNHRVTVYDLSGGITNGMNASYVIGQSTFTGGSATTTQSGLSIPGGVEYDGQNQRLYVSSNVRTLVYDLSSGITNGMNASYVIGQADFTSNNNTTQTQSSIKGARGVTYNPLTDQLFIAQPSISITPYTYRVSIFDVSPGTIANGMDAMDMLGYYSYTAENVRVPDYTMTGFNGGVTEFGLDFPKFSFRDTQNHRLFISDSSNSRVVVHVLDSNNELIDYEADYVLGQSTFNTKATARTQSGMTYPYGLSYDYENNFLFVVDVENYRVMVYDLSGGITNGMDASYVLGQSTFTTRTAAITQSVISSPVAVEYDNQNNRLFVSDFSRVMVYDLSGGITNGMNASYVLGQSTFTAAVNATTQSVLRGVEGLVYDEVSQRLFVANKTTNRVMVYDLSGGITNGMNASYVLGQSTFTASTASTNQNGLTEPTGLAYNPVHQRLYVASGSAGVRVFDVSTSTISNGADAIYIFGKVGFGNNPGSISSQTQSTSGAHGLIYDHINHRLYVTQTSDSRVAIFDAAAAGANAATIDFPNASYVLGQSTFTASTAATTQAGSGSVEGLSFDSQNNRLFATNRTSHRVMVYDLSGGLTNGMNASYVLGQTDFITGTSGLSQSKLNAPKGILYDSDNDRIYVADSNNARIMTFSFSGGGTLDTPVISTAVTEANSVQVSWTSVAGATSYTLSTTATTTPTVTTPSTNYTFSNLIPNTVYLFQVRANNLTTSSLYSDIFSTSTEALLSISNVTTTNISSTTATVSWTTNRLTSSRLLYGYANSFGISTAETNTAPRVMSHQITLSGLLPCTVYHYTPRVVAAGGDIATSTRRTFFTRGCPLATSVISSESGFVSSTTGGSVSFAGGNERLSLTIPTGFSNVSENTAFQVKQMDKDPIVAGTSLPLNKSVVGSLMFDLKAISDDSEIISEFEESVEVTMTYDPADLSGVDPTTLSIYRYTGDVWTQLSSCVTDTTAFTVTCETPGFSLFALMGEEGDEVSSSHSRPPTSVTGSFVINGGLLTTNSRGVTLTFEASRVTHIAISEDSNFTNSSFEPFVSERMYTLSSSSGYKTVYVKFRNEEGSEYVASRSIVLSTVVCGLSPGMPYKSSGSSSVYYITPACTKRPIKNAETYFTYFTSWNDVTVVPTSTLVSISVDELSFMPAGPLYRPTYGALIKTPHDPKVYVLINGVKYWITNEEVFTKLNYQYSWIEDVDPRLLDYYITGSEITDTDRHPAYSLVKYSNSPKVYRLEVGDSGTLTKRWIVNEVAFKALKFRGDRIIVIPTTETYLDGPDLK